MILKENISFKDKTKLLVPNGRHKPGQWPPILFLN
jgi:hypothetical protein